MALGIIALGLIVFYGLNYWQEKKNGNNITPQQKADEIAITDLPTGEKLVENKTQGYSVKVPPKWTIDATKEQFYSPKISQQNTPSNIEIGCKITSSAENKITNIETIKKGLESDINEWYTVELNTYEIINLNNHQALKNIFQATETGFSIAVYVPTSEKLYSFAIYANPQDKEKCFQEFDKFLATISIK